MDDDCYDIVCDYGSWLQIIIQINFININILVIILMINIDRMWPIVMLLVILEEMQ